MKHAPGFEDLQARAETFHLLSSIEQVVGSISGTKTLYHTRVDIYPKERVHFPSFLIRFGASAEFRSDRNRNHHTHRLGLINLD
jgi:hypothetical protein